MDKNLWPSWKFILSFLVLTYFFSFFPKREVILAEEKISEPSATVLSQDKVMDSRVERLKKFLQFHNSPLTLYSHFIVKKADSYSLDWRLVPAISGIESDFGRKIPANSFNAYGFNNGNYYFKDWPDGIETVSQVLKENYIDKGAKSVEQIGRIYAVCPFWALRVNYLIQEIENFNSSSLQFSL